MKKNKKKLYDKKLFFWIIIIAISTVLSFAFDQLVIRTEDEIRNKNIDILNTRKKIDIYKTIDQFLIEIGYQSSKIGETYYDNLFIKSLILLEKEKNYTNAFKNAESTIKFLKKRITRDAYQITYDREQLYYSLQDALNIELSFPETEADQEIKEIINKMNTDLSFPFLYTKDKLIDIMEKNRFLSNSNVKKTILHLIYKEPRPEYSNLKFNDLLNFYYFKNAMIKQLYFDSESLSEISTFFGKKVFIYDLKLLVDFDELKSKHFYKNIYILLSILFQIFSLLTLLILFKIILVNRNITK